MRDPSRGGPKKGPWKGVSRYGFGDPPVAHVPHCASVSSCGKQHVARSPHVAVLHQCCVSVSRCSRATAWQPQSETKATVLRFGNAWQLSNSEPESKPRATSQPEPEAQTRLQHKLKSNSVASNTANPNHNVAERHSFCLRERARVARLVPADHASDAGQPCARVR